MSVPMAYIGVIIVWTTTPLAIQWSGDGPGFLFGVASRMSVATVMALVAVGLFSSGMRWDRKARRAYLAAGLGIYLAMLSVYWSAQYIPSGWISVVFGLSPLITGLFAYLWLGERSISPTQIGGMLLGVAGLLVMFGTSVNMAGSVVYGMLAILFGATVHSASAVIVKQIDADIPAIVQAAGGLLVATPLFDLTWFLFDGAWPQNLPIRAAASILYLATFGSVLGFALYYFVLKRLAATQVALITLVTPVGALLLGNLVEQEPLSLMIITGTGLILTGLALYQVGSVRQARRQRVRPAADQESQT
ncbi:MAG: DMT family transporter [Gammaproteobacteria bacterium]|nr:DMT family transporter [Gammaproteobacteria bacterium]